MNPLRQQYLDAVKQASANTARKQLVSKSACGPEIYCVRDGSGEILGYFPGERVPPEEVQRELAKEKLAVSKSALDDPNAVFDDSALMPQFYDAVQSIGAADVSKSAEDDPNGDLIGIFPEFHRPGRQHPCN